MLYLRECLIQNVGPIESLDFSMPFTKDGTPKPLLLVGTNGSGKTIFLSHIADALVEFAKVPFQDIVANQTPQMSPYFKFVGSHNQRVGAEYGISLLGFRGADDKVLGYVDKTGTLDPATFTEKKAERFGPVNWKTDGHSKDAAPKDKDFLESVFQKSSVAFFGSSRKERPHWFNTASQFDELAGIDNQRISGRLGEPIILESTADETKAWIRDVILDSRADFQLVMPQGDAKTEPQLHVPAWQQSMPAHMGLRNINVLLRSVLQDSGSQIVIGQRSSPFRVAVRLGSGATLPTLDHLSTGQALLFNLFATILRYADVADMNSVMNLGQIEGLVIVDEIDAHLHADLQYEVLPKLIKLFPKVQFILTSHAPLLLLGMEKEFGSNGFQIREMPSGKQISCERFDEFRRSYELYQATKTHEEELAKSIGESGKPLVFTEGETDAKYICAAFEVLDRNDLAEALEVRSVGTTTSKGSKNSGNKGLDNAKRVIESHPDLMSRKTLLLYDCDTKKPDETTECLSSRTIPLIESNTKIGKGIENLLDPALLEDRFYSKKTVVGNYGETNEIQEFKKSEFCDWICSDKKDAETFSNFKVVMEILDEFLGVDSQTDTTEEGE